MSRRAWITASGTCLLAALAITGSTGIFVRHPNPLIHVRWRESVDVADRAALERRFSLQPVGQMGPTTWRYEVMDTSRENIGNVVRHPDVDDTHYVDRATFEIQRDAPRGVRRPGPLGERRPALAFGLVDYGPLVLFALAAGAALCAAQPHLATAATARAALTRGIPELSPSGLAVFRLVYGLALALYVYAQPFPRDVVPPHLQRTDVPLVDVEPIQWLMAHPAVVRAGQWVAVSSATLFAVGILPRLLYAVAVAGIVQWLLALSLQSDSHQFGVLLLPLVGLLAVPWGHAPPISSLLRKSAAPAGASGKRYGYAPWLLAFALGVAWMGAAWAKVREGPGWILNGSVRYHFVSDFSHAHVDWGLVVATMPRLAIILSAGAVLIEALTLTAAFVKMPMLRLALGAAAMSVLTGFYLFQGILWPAWWMLLLGFVPWSAWNATPSSETASPRALAITRAQLFCIVALLAQQLVVSAAFLELPPVASRYDMYSKTHASPEDYERENPGIGRRILAVDDRGITTDVTQCAADLNEPILTTLRTFEPADPPPSTAAFKACHPEGATPKRYLVIEDRCLFDWKAGRFYCVYQDKLIGTLPATE